MFEQIADSGCVVKLRIDYRVSEKGAELLIARPHEQAVFEGIELERVDRNLQLCEPGRFFGGALKGACGDGWAVASPSKEASAAEVGGGVGSEKERGALDCAADVDRDSAEMGIKDEDCRDAPPEVQVNARAGAQNDVSWDGVVDEARSSVVEQAVQETAARWKNLRVPAQEAGHAVQDVAVDRKGPWRDTAEQGVSDFPAAGLLGGHAPHVQSEVKMEANCN